MSIVIISHDWHLKNNIFFPFMFYKFSIKIISGQKNYNVGSKNLYFYCYCFVNSVLVPVEIQRLQAYQNSKKN